MVDLNPTIKIITLKVKWTTWMNHENISSEKASLKRLHIGQFFNEMSRIGTSMKTESGLCFRAEGGRWRETEATVNWYEVSFGGDKVASNLDCGS